jgi:hypothetical protein
MINLKSLLLEVHIVNIFNATDHSRLLSILQDNAIKLGFVGGTYADQQVNRGYPFFLSTMRQKYGNYARKGTEGNNKAINTDTIINLDGRNLTSAGFKLFSVDYWGMGPEASEQEERIASTKDEITPLEKFVKAVHIYVNTNPSNLDKNWKIGIANPHTVERFHKISDIAKTSKFPIYFYIAGNEEYFKAQRTERAIRSLDGVLPEPKWEPADIEHKQWLAQRQPDRDNRATQVLRAFLDIYYEKEIDADKHPWSSVMKWVLFYPRDAHSQISADIHNLKKDHPPIFREFVEIMKKQGFKTVKEMINFVIKREGEKWKIKQDAYHAELKKKHGYD